MKMMAGSDLQYKCPQNKLGAAALGGHKEFAGGVSSTLW